MNNFLEREYPSEQIITSIIATEAGNFPIGLHNRILLPSEICLGSWLKPGKTLLSGNELLARCAKCQTIFIFNQFSFEWIRANMIIVCQYQVEMSAFLQNRNVLFFIHELLKMVVPKNDRLLVSVVE